MIADELQNGSVVEHSFFIQKHNNIVGYGIIVPMVLGKSDCSKSLLYRL